VGVFVAGDDGGDKVIEETVSCTNTWPTELRDELGDAGQDRGFDRLNAEVTDRYGGQCRE